MDNLDDQTFESDNPLAKRPDPADQSSAVASPRRGDLEVALAGLRDGSVTEGEALAAMEQMVDSQIRRTLSSPDYAGTSLTSVAMQLAQLRVAPTNWHQAMIYFLAAKADEDAPLRRKAPFMYAGSVLMVGVQVAALLALLAAMLHPSCVTNSQCVRTGFFCFVGPDATRGNCQMCGEAPPLTPYLSASETWTDNGKLRMKEYNIVTDQSYPSGFMGKRSTTPDVFMGYNMTMVQDACQLPIRSFHWDHDGFAFKLGAITNRGDIPAWIPNERIGAKALGMNQFSSASAARWCAACVHPTPSPEMYVNDGLSVSDEETGLTVSIMNKRLVALTNTNAMSPLDWTALLLCSYLVGLTVAAEIKDIALCEMAAARSIKEITPRWRFALAVLNRIRSQVLMQPLMGAIPAVVLTQGGSAMLIWCARNPVLLRRDTPS
eukprot:COSAG02_NODE_1277_length_13502_cov_14.551593_11_plen_434_part_00